MSVSKRLPTTITESGHALFMHYFSFGGPSCFTVFACHASAANITRTQATIKHNVERTLCYVDDLAAADLLRMSEHVHRGQNHLLPIRPELPRPLQGSARCSTSLRARLA